MTTRAFVLAVAATVIPVSAACGLNPSSGEEVFTRTVAQLNSDGSIAWMKTVPITASQQLLNNAKSESKRANGVVLSARASGLSPQGVYADSSCDDSDIYLYDQFYQNGNELCLYATAPFSACASLSNFPLGSGNWGGKMKSFWTGSEHGAFSCGDNLYCPGSGWNLDQKYTACGNCSYSICFTD